MTKLILGSNVSGVCSQIGNLVPSALVNPDSLERTEDLTGKLLLASNISAFNDAFYNPEICNEPIANKIISLWLKRQLGRPQLITGGCAFFISSSWPIVEDGVQETICNKMYRFLLGQDYYMQAASVSWGVEWRLRKWTYDESRPYPYTDPFPAAIDPGTGTELSGTIKLHTDGYSYILDGCPDTTDIQKYKADMTGDYPVNQPERNIGSYYKLEVKSDIWPDYTDPDPNSYINLGSATYSIWPE